VNESENESYQSELVSESESDDESKSKSKRKSERKSESEGKSKIFKIHPNQLHLPQRPSPSTIRMSWKVVSRPI
jgi:hypothetical protein